MNDIRAIPYDPDAEAAIATLLVVLRVEPDEARAFGLQPWHFLDPVLRAAVDVVFTVPGPHDPISIAADLRSRGIDPGGRITALIYDPVPSRAMLRRYVDLVADAARRRLLIRLAADVTEHCYHGTDPTEAIGRLCETIT